MEILRNINEISVYLFYVCYIILFYASLKKCFLREGYSKVKLFFLSLITNPFFIFVISIVFSAIIVFVRESRELGLDFSSAADWDYLINVQFDSSLIVLIGTIIFIMIIVLISYLMGKHLKAYNMSFVMFVYIIFSVVVVLVDGHSLEIPKETGFVFGILYNLSNIINVVVVCLIYLLIISALSKLSGKKRQVNWKLFLIPPSVFISFYSVLDFYTSEFSSIDANLVVSVLSYVILILFIWAFYIIINNIKATDDAIMAKNDIQTLSVEVMEALAHTIDAKDEYTRGHSIRVARYSRMIASKMGLSSEQSENIYYMGLLHDIGKIGVPNEIINKPGKLTDEEFGQIRKHPVTGFDILAEIKSRPSLSIGARWHHERVDGKGYPDHKSGEEIPIEARIIAVADSYDAMTSNRSYRQYLPQDVVRSEIENNIGSQFDEMAAKCMLQIIDEDTEYVLHE